MKNQMIFLCCFFFVGSFCLEGFWTRVYPIRLHQGEDGDPTLLAGIPEVWRTIHSQRIDLKFVIFVSFSSFFFFFLII